jgi:hypothetical protein
MKAITLRNLPPEIVKTIRQKAEEQGVSINKAVISLLEEGTGQRNKTKGNKYPRGLANHTQGIVCALPLSSRMRISCLNR